MKTWTSDEVLSCAKRMKFYGHDIASNILIAYAERIKAGESAVPETDVHRLLKDTLFACIATGKDQAVYGGVAYKGGAAKIAFSIEKPTADPELQGGDDDFETWFSKQDSRTEWLDLVRLAYAVQAEPAQAAQVPDWQRNCPDFPNCPNLGCPCEPKAVDGWVLVPREPTDAMIDSYPFDPTVPCDRVARVKSMWFHMIAAAPTPAKDSQ